eukprot:TRINITY_DN4887_c0_g4_i1.p1 TRINITY_DN4887_c0_g4~~TRINITY_DN4887_c0_g4_i1.p1  ORF type:complete len:327 (+),score=49.42 TRINITY_DN4887_c0_g4_i1:84-1064(+)
MPRTPRATENGLRNAAGRAPGLQRGLLPRKPVEHREPDKNLSLSSHKPANLHAGAFETTTEAYMYDVIYDYFRHDDYFWKQWDIVDCAPSVPDVNQKARQENAAIRMVVNKPSHFKLPKSYPPDAPDHVPRSIPGLPDGFKVPLHAFTVEDGESFLETQRLFHDGEIQPQYRWLEDIINRNRALQDERGTGGNLAIKGYSTRSVQGSGVVPRPKSKVTSGAGFLRDLQDWGTGIFGGWLTQDGPVEDDPTRVTAFSSDAVAWEENRNNLVSAYNMAKLSQGRPFGQRGSSAREQPVDDSPVEPEDSGAQLDVTLASLLSRDRDLTL